MRELLQPEMKKATSKARNMSKSVFNTWLNERKILKARQVPVVTVQQMNRVACPSIYTCFAWGRGSLGRSPVWAQAIMLGQTSRPSRALAHMTAVMAIISKEVLSLLHMPRREAHVICAVEVACALKPMGLCLFQLLLGIQCNPSQESLTAWELAGSQLSVAFLLADHWGIYYKLQKYFSQQIWACHCWHEYALKYTSGKKIPAPDKL